MPIKRPTSDKPNLKGGGSTPYTARTTTAFRPLTYRRPLRKSPLPPHQGSKWGHVANLTNKLADTAQRISHDIQEDNRRKLDATKNRAIKYYEEAATRRAGDLFTGKTNWKQIRNDEKFVDSYAERYGIEYDEAKTELDHNFKQWQGVDYANLTDTVYRTKAASYDGLAKDFKIDEATRKRARKYLGAEGEKSLFSSMRMALFERDIKDASSKALAIQKEMFTGNLNEDLKEMVEKGDLNKSEAIELRNKVSTEFMKSAFNADKIRTVMDKMNNDQAVANETGFLHTLKGNQDRSQRELSKMKDSYNSQISSGIITPTNADMTMRKIFNDPRNRGFNLNLKNAMLTQYTKQSDQAVDSVFKAFIPTGLPHAKVLAENRQVRSLEGREFAEKFVQKFAQENPGMSYDSLVQGAGVRLQTVATQAGISDFTLADSDIPLVEVMRIMKEHPDIGKSSPGGLLTRDSFIDAFTSVEKAKDYKQKLADYLSKDISTDKRMVNLKLHLKDIGLFEPILPPAPPPPPGFIERIVEKTKSIGKTLIKPFTKDESGNKDKSKQGK